MAKRLQPRNSTTVTNKLELPEKSVKIRKSSKFQISDASSCLFPIVAIGASAGGLEALEQFLTNVNIESGMAYIVIQHLDPKSKGMLPELLQRMTTLPVVQIKSSTKVRPNHIYVIPPNKDLSVLHGRLHLLEPVAAHGLRLPIDFFFRNLADDIFSQAIGVILSGMGSDGTLGISAIKENGGLVLVQDPATAKFDSMPRNAISTSLVDIIASADQLPSRIIDYLNHTQKLPVGTSFKEIETEEQKSGFEKVCILLRTRTGHDFSSYKKSTVYRRIERRMAIHQLNHMADYVRYLRENGQEIDLLFKELLIGVTNFFRDPEVWLALQEKALPELLATLPQGTILRAWVAGCSTGEEAYSLAIAFREVLELTSQSGKYSLQIFATDLDPDAINKARQGNYPLNISADVSEERLKRYFIEDNNTYRVGKEIREMVVFAPQNVIMDPPFTKLDLLTCRNLLIYLNTNLQRKLIPLFHYSIKPGGILMLGSAETIGSHTELFAPVGDNTHIFKRTDQPLRALEVEFPARHTPTHPLTQMNTTTVTSPLNLQSLADQLIQQRFSPAAVLVNAAGDLVYISGRTGNYLEAAAGKVNWNIHAMAREGLRQEIVVALPKALRSGQEIVIRNLRVGTNGGTQRVDLIVHPILEPAALSGMVLVVFNNVTTPATLETLATGKRIRRSPRVAELESELAQARQALLTLHEEMQTSQEELKSTNEELQSTNEELQSTNEELTTSKEEMQSMNEEMQTVNAELQSKVDELSLTNSDMKNLLNSTDIATVFLDNALNVRRFTTQATRIFKLLPSDVGRPLSDIVSDLVDLNLLKVAEEVLRTLAYSDREVATRDGRWFQVKIMPYRTLDNVIDGVVITLNDISTAKLLESKLRQLGAKGS